MPSFSYVAKDIQGSEVSGRMAAPSPTVVVDELHRRGLIVLSIAHGAAPGVPGGVIRWLRSREVIPSRVGVRQLALFSRQLATMVNAGLPLVRSLASLARDETHAGFRKVLLNVSSSIESGVTFGEALKQHPSVFSPLFVAMIRAGETSGTLDDILERVADYLERVDAIQTKVRSATAYPIFVSVFALVATGFLILKIVPTFAEIYKNFGAELPGPTQALITISQVMRHNALVVLLVLGALVAAFLAGRRTPAGRFLLDGIKLRMPIFGVLVRKSVLSRLARTLACLLRSGLPVLESLSLVRETCGNAVVARAVDRVSDRIRSGMDLATAFGEEKIFPEMLIQMIATGQETGSVDRLLDKASDFYDRQVEAAVAGMTALVEPLLIVCVGTLVGLIVVVMFLPVFHLGRAVGTDVFQGK